MTRYEVAKRDAYDVIENMIGKYHAPLRDAEVKVDCMFAFATTDDNGDIVGAPVKLHGYQCLAIIRIVNLRDRTAGQGDAQIIIDGDKWPEMSDEERDALIDHELTHLELRTDKDGLVVRDDLNRPKLRLRKHDHQFGWFDSIARRHGGASIEIKQWNEFQESRRQMWLKFEDDPEPDYVEPKAEVKEPEDDEDDSLKRDVEKTFEKAGIKVVKNPKIRTGRVAAAGKA